MTREEAIKLLVNATYSDEWQGNEDLTTAHHMAVKALEFDLDKHDEEVIKNTVETLWGEPCEDCISRQAVHDLLATWLSDYLTDETREALETIDYKIEDLQPVTPQTKIGRWIYTGDYITEGMLKCSECGFEHDVSERFSYCPNCGAKMEEV